MSGTPSGVSASSHRGDDHLYAPANIMDEDEDTYWATDDGIHTGSIEIAFKEPKTIRYVHLQEYIRLGQRVKSFHVEIMINGAWKKVADGTTIGYKRIVPIDRVTTDMIRVTITDSRACPLISDVGIF